MTDTVVPEAELQEPPLLDQIGPPSFDDVEAERLYLKQRLAATFRLFGRFGFDEGVAGHVTARDPGNPERFWVNGFGVNFKHMRVSDLICVDHDGNIVEGDHPLNQAAFAIHSRVHKARPDVVAAAHAHSIYGKTWSAFRRPLEPLTQDSCAFYQDHAVFEDFTGVVLDVSEGDRIAEALGGAKAAILSNHGNLTVGHSVDEAAFWFITMERTCQAQLLASSVRFEPTLIDHQTALATRETAGSNLAGWFSFQPLFDWISRAEPDLFE
ncbi:MAG: class II aldolase/adducin family protein [Actinomycetota bacterium]